MVDTVPDDFSPSLAIADAEGLEWLPTAISCSKGFRTRAISAASPPPTVASSLPRG